MSVRGLTLNEIIFYFLICSSFVIALLLTSKYIYSEYFGFELLVSFFSLVNLTLLHYSSKIKRGLFSYIAILAYAFLVVASVANNPKSVYHALVYVNLVYFFLVVAPSLNRSIKNWVNIMQFLNWAIFLVIFVFILLNINLYYGEGFFLSKDKYTNLLSNPNTIGYLTFLGFSISLLLFERIKRRRYFYYACFYLVSLIFIPPVLTAYLSIISYLVIYSVFRSSVQVQFIAVLFLVALLFIGVYYFIANIDSYRFLLSYRDRLFEASFQKIAVSPWLGYGVENWDYLFLEMKNPHNFLLYQMLSFGIVAAALYFMFFVRIAIEAYRKSRAGYRKFYVHVFSQIIVNVLVMSVFVAMPGNYQDISIFLSIIFIMLINASSYVTNLDGEDKNKYFTGQGSYTQNV